jgi:hypothetical protein
MNENIHNRNTDQVFLLKILAMHYLIGLKSGFQY